MAAVTDAWADDLGELRVEPAPNVIRGGCRIQRNDSLVDATIETQLRNIIMELANVYLALSVLPESRETCLMALKSSLQLIVSKPEE